jgi:hypothetical protein
MKPRVNSYSNTLIRPDEDPIVHPCDAENVECLRIVVAHLLNKNQELRFELYSANQKLMSIERLFFGSESRQMEHMMPADVRIDLRNLCKTPAQVRNSGYASSN